MVDKRNRYENVSVFIYFESKFNIYQAQTLSSDFMPKSKQLETE